MKTTTKEMQPEPLPQKIADYRRSFAYGDGKTFRLVLEFPADFPADRREGLETELKRHIAEIGAVVVE